MLRLLVCSHLTRRDDGIDNTTVAGASTEVAAQCSFDPIGIGSLAALEQGGSADGDSWSTEATLHTALGLERLRQDLPLLLGQALEGGDLLARHTRGIGQTGKRRTPGQQNRAAAAETLRGAAVFGRGDAEPFPQHLEQRLISFVGDYHRISVQGELDLGHGQLPEHHRGIDGVLSLPLNKGVHEMRFDSRFVLVSTALFICLGLAAPASAGNLRIFGSYWDTSDAGAFMGGGVRYTFSDTLGLSLGGTAYFEGDEFNLGNLEVDTIDNTAWDIGVHVSISELFYFNVGASYYQFDSNLGDADDEWGYYGLLGATIGGQTFRFFIEAMYRDASATIRYDDLEIIQGELDLDVSGFGANAGLEWRF